MSLGVRFQIKKIIACQKLFKIIITQSNCDHLFNLESKICQEVGTISMVLFDYLKEESRPTKNSHHDANSKEKHINKPRT